MKKQMCGRLKAMLHDEKIAPRDYSKLKKTLPVEYRPKITRIQSQERQHFKTLKGIKRDIKEDMREGEYGKRRMINKKSMCGRKYK